ncbi:MAG: CoF synthetase [Flavobacteriaceae bacterium]|nr:CoF synthetase [Flavobacteriaceae bacterium]
MQTSIKLRRNIFWLSDSFRGSIVKNHLLEIAKNLNEYNSKESILIRNNNLKNILEHAVSTVPFYSKYSSFKELINFPILNKNIIRDNFKDLQSSKFIDKKKNIVSTSGSTGTPFQIVQDVNKRYRNWADTIFFASRAGYEIGEYLIYIKLWSKVFGVKKIKGYFKNLRMHSVYKLSDNDISKLLDEIKSKSSGINMIAYSSSFEKIVNYLERNNSKPIQCNIKSMIAISERLSNRTKELVQKYFNCQVVSRYSNNENGILAQQNLIENNVFEINWASYFIEILELDEDIPVKNGAIGRVVVTDFFNYAMPIIRYDTGDLAVMNIDKQNIPFLERIEGRKLDMIYNTSGELVSSHLAYHLCKYGNFRQFQLVQYGLKKYEINLNTDTKIVDEYKLIEEYKGYLGRDANIKINYVNEIPILSSGKRQEVINTYYKS